MSKIIRFKNPKAVQLILEKEKVVKEGRKLSQKIEKVEKEIEKMTAQEQEYSDAINPTELLKKGNDINAQIDRLIEELEKVSKEVTAVRMANIPKALLDKNAKAKKYKEDLERERNRKALTAQKVKDKLIPIIRKTIIPMLEEFEDNETAYVEKGEVVVKVYNRMDAWKEKNRKKPEDETEKQQEA